MDFRHLIVTCLFSKLRLPFDNQKVKENYAIFYSKIGQDYTLLIYIMHVSVIFFITRLIKDNTFINPIYDYCGAIIVFIITLLSYSIKEGTFLFTKSKKINE